MLWFFLIFSTLCWGIAEIFYKKGSLPNEKYSHLKTAMFVGFFMGIYALVIFISQCITPDDPSVGLSFLTHFPINFVCYLPVGLCYMISMVLSYFGVRYIEESISDPIENTSGAIVPILCAIFLKEFFDWPVVIGIVIVALGVIAISFFDKKGKEDRRKKYGKKLAIWAIAMPFCYMILDAVGTFLDIFYTESIDSTILVGLTEDNLEHAANCAYEFMFLLFAIGIFIFLKIKKVKIFETGEEPKLETGEVVPQKWYQKVLNQKWKILAAIFETAGQATYLFALSEGSGIAAVILGAGTVITSFILSRVFLKEKLSWLQYIFIGIIFAGIIMLALLGV